MPGGAARRRRGPIGSSAARRVAGGAVRITRQGALLTHVARRLPHEGVVQARLAAEQQRRRAMRVGSSAASTIASTPRRLASSHDRLARRGARARSRSRPRRPRTPPPPPWRARSAARARLSCASGSARVERQRHRHLEDPQRLDHRAALAARRRPPRPASRPAVCMMSSSSGVPRIGTRIEPYSASARSPRQRRLGHRHALEHRLALRACGRRRRARAAERHPAEPDPARAAVGDHERDPARRRQQRAEHGRQRQRRRRATRHVERHPVRAVAVGLLQRSATTDRCAIVSASVAPNA